MFRYLIYETKRKRRRAGTPTSASGATNAGGRVADFDRPNTRCKASVPLSLAGYGTRRAARLVCQAASRSKETAGRCANSAVGNTSVARCSRAWLAQQLMDGQASNPGDPPAFRDKTSSGTRTQYSEATVGLDQSETPKTCPGTQRERDPAVAARGVSAYKKTLLVGERTWFSQMNRVSCSARPFAEPWPLVVRHPFTIAGIDEIASRPSVPSPSAPFADVGDCTLSFWRTTKTFMPKMWWAFCVSLSVILPARLRLSGIAARFMIALRWFGRIWPNIWRLLPKGFLLTRRNSTPMNKSGRTSNMAACRILPHGILKNCVSVLGENCATCGNALTCWVRLYSTLKSLLGFDICLFI